MANLGSWLIDDYIIFPANISSLSTGGKVDPDSNPTYWVYEDETATNIATGSLTKHDSARLGFYTERLQLTAANGFEKGKCYNVLVEATIGGVVVSKSDNFQVAQVTRETLDAIVETGTISPTMAQAFRLLMAASVGKVAGAGTSNVTIRDINDTKDRVDATVSSGNRTAVTLILT